MVVEDWKRFWIQAARKEDEGLEERRLKARTANANEEEGSRKATLRKGEQPKDPALDLTAGPTTVCPR